MKRLLYYGGQGFEHSNEVGKFEVKAKETKQFNRLSKAQKYYESLTEPKAIWDVTYVPELLEAWF